MTQLAAKFSSQRLIILCVTTALVATAIVVKYAPERFLNGIKDYGAVLGAEVTVVNATKVLDYLRKHPPHVVVP